MLKIILPFLLFFFLASNAQLGKRFRNKQNANTSDLANPEYNNLYYWASHPAKHDFADSIPPFLADEKRDTSADVFFIHPTTFTKDFFNSGLNADFNDTSLNVATDKKTILLQASIFNGSCRVFAPRYRQAHLKSFFNKDESSHKASLEFAYQDVKAAFQYYLTYYNHGRPIIIAGHSQGAFHAIHLLKEFFDGKPLQKKLVCAYLVGWQIKKDDFVNLPFGTSPKQTGCVLGWRSFRSGTDDKITEKENGNSLCVNPITWTTDSTPSDKADHKGMVGRKFDQIYAHIISASVEPSAKILWVDLPNAQDESHGFINNFHIADFNMFYMDVRVNVQQRIAAYLHK